LRRQRAIFVTSNSFRKPEEATKLLSIGESPTTTLDGKAPEELAAWTSLANVLLNLDETITRK
jgi:hypothetical protein